MINIRIQFGTRFCTLIQFYTQRFIMVRYDYGRVRYRDVDQTIYILVGKNRMFCGLFTEFKSRKKELKRYNKEKSNSRNSKTNFLTLHRQVSQTIALEYIYYKTMGGIEFFIFFPLSLRSRPIWISFLFI